MQETATSTIMAVKTRDNETDITEIIVYDKATNIITISVEHKPGFKVRLSDNAK